jgi:hypothetical protein
VHEHILAHLRLSTKLFADETTAPVLDPGRGRTKTGQLWAYARDDRPWGGSDPPAVAYVYAPDRKASQPIAHLAGFKGVLQVDGYAGYRARNVGVGGLLHQGAKVHHLVGHRVPRLRLRFATQAYRRAADDRRKPLARYSAIKAGFASGLLQTSYTTKPDTTRPSD